MPFNSEHLTCSIHVRKNTKAKLQELGIAEDPKRVIFSKRRKVLTILKGLLIVQVIQCTMLSLLSIGRSLTSQHLH